jgi:hypothetical protein
MKSKKTPKSAPSAQTKDLAQKLVKTLRIKTGIRAGACKGQGGCKVT